MKSFEYEKKIEHEALAEKALKNKDYVSACFHTKEAARFAYILAQKCEGMELLQRAYVHNGNGLVALAEDLQKKAEEQKEKRVASNGKTATAAPGETMAEKNDQCLVERPDVRLDDVAGLDDVKRQIRLRVIEPLAKKDNARMHDVTVGGGILLYGPPGTGKTFLAKAVAGELGLPFYSITPADVFGKYVGESENNIRNIFRAARKHELSVIFMDELETLAPKRTGEQNESTANKVLNELLQELDGIRPNENPILLLGATNAPWLVDEAFMRAGRADVRAYVGFPELAARKKIIENAFKSIQFPIEDGAISFLAEQTEGMSGADLTGIATSIKQTAFERDLSTYTKALFEECLKDFSPSISIELEEKIREWEKKRGITRIK